MASYDPHTILEGAPDFFLQNQKVSPDDRWRLKAVFGLEQSAGELFRNLYVDTGLFEKALAESSDIDELKKALWRVIPPPATHRLQKACCAAAGFNWDDILRDESIGTLQRFVDENRNSLVEALAASCEALWEAGPTKQPKKHTLRDLVLRQLEKDTRASARQIVERLHEEMAPMPKRGRWSRLAWWKEVLDDPKALHIVETTRSKMLKRLNR